MITRGFDSISLIPWWRDLRNYNIPYLRDDLRAGLTVALLALPQAMTYALIAGLPATVGIFSVIFGCIFTAAFGSSAHLVAGSTNAIAILIQSAIAEVLYTHYRYADPMTKSMIAVQVTVQLTFMIGMLQMLAGAFKLGRLTQFVSRSVVLGYIAGAAIAIIVNQGFYFVGMPRVEMPYPLYEKVWVFFAGMRNVHWPTAAIGVGGLAILVILPRIKKNLPEQLIMLLLMSLTVYVFNLSPSSCPLFSAEEHGVTAAKVALIRDSGIFQGLLPSWESPFFNVHIVNDLIPIAFAIALMGVLEMTSVAKSIAATSGQHLSINQDIFGLGIGNIFSALFGAMTSSGSPSRSYLNFNTGAKTRFAAVFCGLFVIAILFFFGGFVICIPLAALSALLLTTAVRMVNFQQMKFCLKATPEDTIVLFITMISCLIFTFNIAFYIGVGISIGFYLHKSARPYLVECSFSEDEGMQVIDDDDKQHKQLIRIIHLEGEFFFGSVDMFQHSLKVFAEDEHVKVIVLNMHNARHMDATACLVLKQLYEYLKRSGRFLLPANVPKPIWKVLKRSGLLKEIGNENVFMLNEHYPNLSIRQALARAEALVNV